LEPVMLALVRKAIVRPGADQNVDGFVVPRPAFFERDIRWAEEPSMPAPQAAFEASVGKDVGLGDLPSKAHGVFERKRKEGHSKANAFCPLRRSREKREGIGGNRKLLEKMMVDHGVDIESRLVGMLNLPENLPSHFGMGFSRGRLHFGVDT